MIRAPTYEEMGDVVARLSKGAVRGLRYLGFLALDDLPARPDTDKVAQREHDEGVTARVAAAFVRFAKVVNDPDPAVSGISHELRAVSRIPSGGGFLLVFADSLLCRSISSPLVSTFRPRSSSRTSCARFIETSGVNYARRSGSASQKKKEDKRDGSTCERWDGALTMQQARAPTRICL